MKNSPFHRGEVSVNLVYDNREFRVMVPAWMYTESVGNMELGVHRTVILGEDNKPRYIQEWSVTEPRSGMYISRKNDTRAEAVRTAAKRLEELKEAEGEGHINEAIFKAILQTQDLPTLYTMEDCNE